MKILAAGDIHGDTTLAEKLAQRAEEENVDYVVLCGDLTHFEKTTDNIVGPFKKHNQKVLIIPGNHESEATTDFLCEQYDCFHLHGYSIQKDNVGIFGCGGANIGINQMTEDEIFNMLSKAHNNVGGLKNKIMVTHVHPAGSKMEKFTSFFKGSDGIRKAIDTFKPKIMLCSHVHEAEGIEEMIGNTKVINVGKNGKIIELDDK